MAFAWPVPGELVGSSQAWEYVASRVIPIAWIQAPSLFQHLHRQVGMSPEPKALEGCHAVQQLFLLAFDAMLRRGELYQLRKRDITWAGGCAVLSLKNTKSGQRAGAEEVVLCNSQVANTWLAGCGTEP